MFKKIVVAAIVAFAASADQTQAVQIKTNAKVNTAVEANTEQKWGFLKNIVNIDRFFDSGVKAWASDREHHPIFSTFIWLMQWTI